MKQLSPLADQRFARLADREAIRERTARYRIGMQSGMVASTRNEIRDAFATHAVAGRFAVAEGNRRGERTGDIARAFVSAWVEDPPPVLELQTFLERAMDAWDAIGDAPRTAADERGRQDGPRSADLAAFAAVELVRTQSGPHSLRANVIGGSSVFVVRSGKIVHAWNSVDARLSSARSSEGAGTGRGLTAMEVPVRPNDEVFLMTSNLARWTLDAQRANRFPFSKLRRASTNIIELTRFIKRARAGEHGERRIADRDATLVHFRVPYDSPT